MQMKVFLLLALTGSTLVTSAQNVKEEQPAKKGSSSFSSINQIGFISGSRGVRPLLQTINGVKFNTWFIGVGVGIDGYYRGGAPVFVDIRKDLLKDKVAPYIYLNGGYQIVLKSTDHGFWGSRTKRTYSNGPYTDAGLGIKFGENPKLKWLVSAGYSYKYVERREEYDNGGCASCGQNVTLVESSLNRFTLKVGVQL